MADKILQELDLDEPVTFETVVATAYAEGVPAEVHDDKNFTVQAKDRS